MAQGLRRHPRHQAVDIMRRETLDREVLGGGQRVMLVIEDVLGEEDEFTAAISRVLAERGEELRLARIARADMTDLLEAYRRNKGYRALRLDKRPVALFFRDGRPITTFNPTLTSSDPAVRNLQIRRQLQTFLEKFLHFDPEKLTFNHGVPDTFKSPDSNDDPKQDSKQDPKQDPNQGRKQDEGNDPA